MTTQFQGERPWDAIIHDNSLDIEEEEEFRLFAAELGYDENSDLEQLEFAYEQWELTR
jgi:hypothetical protein